MADQQQAAGAPAQPTAPESPEAQPVKIVDVDVPFGSVLVVTFKVVGSLIVVAFAAAMLAGVVREMLGGF